jgi:3-oxoacyl-[acyl-carrier protein] reductase
MALALARQGARVALTARQPSPELARTEAELADVAGPGRVLAMVADVRSYEACQRAADRTLEAFGRIDVLVNNAGLGMRAISESYIDAPPGFWDADPAAWREIVDTNVNGPFNMARGAVPSMLAQGFGKVINVTTSHGVLSRRGMSPYGPSKAAVESLSQIWARDLAGTGVDVNLLFPGAATDTEILPESRRRRGELLPASVMVPGLLWLCSNDSNGRSGRRYNARLWDRGLPAAQAAALASEPLLLGPGPA